MKRLNKYRFFALVGGVSAVLALQSCVAEDLVDTSQDSIGQDSSVTYHAPNRFAAFHIVLQEDGSTRAAFDSDYSDLEGKFNKGLPFESALYFPSDDPIEEEPENPQEPEQPEDRRDPDTSEQHFHFAILFDKDGHPITHEVLPLDVTLDPDKKYDREGLTAYVKFYDPAVEDNPFLNFEGSIYVVVNASFDLEQRIRNSIKDESSTLYSLTGLVLMPSENNEDFDNYMYLKDKNGRYITDSEGNPYFTMSSSMIIKDTKVVPAIEGDFKTYNTEEEAKSNPTSLYLERLQAKYSVLFKAYSDYKVGTDNRMQQPVGNLYYLTTGSLDNQGNGTGQTSFYPTNRLIISPCGVNAYGELVPGSTPKPLKYVSRYTRSDAIGDRNNVEVHTTTDWKVNIIGWGINAVESREYLFKKMSTGAEYTSASWFNSVDNRRTYWAEDPHYNEGVYPDQYREARYLTPLDAAGQRNIVYDINPDVWHVEHIEYLVDGTDRGTKGLVEPTLKYFNFNELSNKNARTYIPEHTFYASRFKAGDSYDNKAQLRYGTHLIIAAQLMIKGEASAPFEPSNVYDSGFFDPNDGTVVSSFYRVRSKYLMNDIFWEESAYINYVTEYLGYWMLTEENKKIFGRGNNDGIFYVNREGAVAEAGDFVIEQAHIKGGDAMVWVKPAEGVTLYAFNPDLEDDEETPEDDRYVMINPDDYRVLAYEHRNYMALCFNEGRMYYAAPSSHANPSRIPTVPTTGDYGTVRNNWYYFTIEGISSPGTPVSDFNQPIVPNNEPEETALGVSIQLMDWRLQSEDVSVDGQFRPSR